jgi:hypothetical protein
MRKRRRAISLLMVFIIGLSFNLSGNYWAHAGSTEALPIGILSDGYQKDCIINRNGKNLTAVKGMDLLAGDEITKEPDVNELKISYFPYASGENISKTKLKMTFHPPKDELDFLAKFQALIGFETERTIEVSNRGSYYYNLLKRREELFTCGPFPAATLFGKGEIRFFTRAGAGDLLVFSDAGQKEISQTQLVKGKATLSEGGPTLKPGHTYYWRRGKQGPYIRFTVLRPEIEKGIAMALAQIVKDGGKEAEMKLKEVIYLQAISAVYPDRINMEWLSYEILRDLVLSPDQLNQGELSRIDIYLEQIYAAQIEYALDEILN